MSDNDKKGWFYTIFNNVTDVLWIILGLTLLRPMFRGTDPSTLEYCIAGIAVVVIADSLRKIFGGHCER